MSFFIMSEFNFAEEQREKAKIPREFVENVARLCILGNEFRDLEERVLNTKNVLTGYGESGKEIYQWNDQQTISEYHELRLGIMPLLEKTEKFVSQINEEGIGFFVDGSYVGFPITISFRDYIPYIQHKVLFPIRDGLKKLDAYIREEESK